MTTRLLAGLNPEQRAAVEHFEGPILVLAGAGSGKTRVLTARIVHLVEEFGVDPNSILAVTFTNKAAGEMRDRVRHLLGREPAGMWIGTFHAMGVRLMRRHAARLGWTPNFTIYDADQAERETKRVLERLNLPPKRWSPAAVHSMISGAKNQLVGPEAYAGMAGDPYTRIVAQVYPEYQKSLRDQNAFDFDDLLVKPVELFQQHPAVLADYRKRFNFVLVDEYQDTNHAQYKFVELLAQENRDAGGSGGNLMVVGDDDQSIYGWRGADIRNILEFEKGFPGARIVRLEQNYRSTANILDAANAVIAQNLRRKGKNLRTDAGPGERITLTETADERDEAEWIIGEIEERAGSESAHSYRDFVILYRTNAQSRALEVALRDHGIQYQIIGGTRFYERREIMDVVAYLRLIANPRDTGAFDRIVNYPRRGVGDVTRTRLLAWAGTQGLSALDASLRADEVDGVGKAGAAALRGFAELIARFRALALHLGAGELLERLVAEIGLPDALREEGPEGEDRLANVAELVASAHAFDEAPLDPEEAEHEAEATPVARFLHRISLYTDADRHDPERDGVTLMTLHNAKGLEYPFVFISGLEDGLFPLARAYEEPDMLEEERRLFYVGITRARQKLYLSHARTRRRAGEVLPGKPSSFLAPLPESLLDERSTPAVQQSRHGYSRWGAQSFGGLRRRERPPRDEPAGLVVEYDDPHEMPRFVKGEMVRHPQFGRGVIRELSGFGLDLKAVIEFQGVGRKKVVVRYANLQKEL